MALTPEQHSLYSQIGALESWARTVDRTARTANARKAADARFEKQVDPEGKLPPELRAKMAENARQAYYKRLALKSAAVRRSRRMGGDDHAATA